MIRRMDETILCQYLGYELFLRGKAIWIKKLPERHTVMIVHPNNSISSTHRPPQKVIDLAKSYLNMFA